MASISLKVSDMEKKFLQSMAQFEGVTLSELIKSINEQKNGMVVVKIQNVDDFYEQEFAFNSMGHFENWFRKYVI